MTPQIIAHRGASYLAPENTLAAFRLAGELGADGIEFDVQQTRDGGLIVHHDYIIDFHTQLSGNIYDMLEGELRELDFGAWKNVDFTGEQIPTLDEALAVGRELGTMMVELKSTITPDASYVPRVVEAIEAADCVDRVVLIAFQHDLLRQARELQPDLKVGVLLYGALEGMFVPPPSLISDLGLRDHPLAQALYGPQAAAAALEIVEEPDALGEENSAFTRWVSNQVTMLRASFPGEGWLSILADIAAQREPAEYAQNLSFHPDYISCEYHTAFVQHDVVDKLHAQGIKAGFWTPDTRHAIRSLAPLAPDALITNRPDRVREWLTTT